MPCLFNMGPCKSSYRYMTTYCVDLWLSQTFELSRPLPMFSVDSVKTSKCTLLVHLEVHVNVSNKFKGCNKGHSAQHKEEHIACQQCVTKELNGLKHSWHVGSLVVVKHGITKHKPRCGATRKKDKESLMGTIQSNSHPLNSCPLLSDVLQKSHYCQYNTVSNKILFKWPPLLTKFSHFSTVSMSVLLLFCPYYWVLFDHKIFYCFEGKASVKL